jgi:hypothetical protein
MSQANQPSENSKAIVGAIKFFAACIILAAVVYSEVLFLGIIGNLFPSGPLAIGAMIGAVTTGLSIIALCLGKSHWFRPGQQLIVAWIFTGIEVGVLIMNDILAYQLHTGAQVCLQEVAGKCVQMGVQLDQFTSMWRLFCVATPALSLVGWILLFYFSPERTIMHKRMELEDRQQKAKIDLDTTVHRKAMDFHYRAIDMVGSGMEAQIQQLLGPVTELAARQKLAQIASDLTGTHISHNQLTGNSPKQISGKVVEADRAKPALAASIDHVVDPHQVKPEIDNEAKWIGRKPSLADRIWSVRDAIDKKIDGDDKPILEENAEGTRTRRLGGSEEFEKQEAELPENYLDWSDAQWKAAKDQLTKEQYDELFDTAFPPDGLKPTKRTGGKKAKKQVDQAD